MFYTTKTTIKAITITFNLYLFFIMLKDISHNMKGNFDYNNTNYAYEFTFNLNKSRNDYLACINSTCYDTSNFCIDYNKSMIETFSDIFNTSFGYNNTEFSRMVNKDMVQKTYLEDPYSYIIYIPTFICILVFL